MKVLLGVTGSVAAILTPELVKAFQTQGHQVQVVATPRSLYFFDRVLVGTKVWTDKDEWPEGGYRKEQRVCHIDLGKWADVLVIAPLTANTLSDIVNGRCDKFLTNIVRAWPREKPVVIAPAMNTNMWTHPITNLHLQYLMRWYKLAIAEPVEKRLACGDVGMGAMADIRDIVEKADSFFVEELMEMGKTENVFMQIVYAGEDAPKYMGKSIFLAGPTPRSEDVASWRPEALKILEELGFRGTVFVPEPRDNHWHEDYDDQIEWEEKYLTLSDCILFWIPRDLETMPAFTTNIEWGTWYKSGKVVLGAPPEAPKMNYQRYYARKLDIPMATTLRETIRLALQLMSTRIKY